MGPVRTTACVYTCEHTVVVPLRVAKSTLDHGKYGKPEQTRNYANRLYVHSQ
jgi:hypothetical protein